MSNIILHVEPQTEPMTWKQFIKKAGSNSVALDGYVADGPLFDEKRAIANFNHHEKVNRLATRATCSQILMAIRLGFFDYFRDSNGEIQMDVYVNDNDEDCCLSWFLLKNGFMTENVINPNLNRLVSIEDALDTTSGAYPYPKDLEVLKEVAWVFEPYRRFRMSGQLNNKNADDFKSVIEYVERRIFDFILGKAQKIPLDVTYKVLGGGKNWKIVDEVGSYARTGMVSDKIMAFLSVKERQDGRWNYVIGKMSPFVNNFDIPLMFKRLNEAEDPGDGLWGGSDIIGGSPRVKGSKLNPSEVEKIIKEITGE